MRVDFSLGGATFRSFGSFDSFGANTWARNYVLSRSCATTACTNGRGLLRFRVWGLGFRAFWPGGADSVRMLNRGIVNWRPAFCVR